MADDSVEVTNRPVSSNIVVVNPQPNPDGVYAEFSATYERGKLLKQLQNELDQRKITSTNHPKVIILYAGNAPEARVFVEKGWLPEEITSIDQHQPINPHIEGLSWKYIDLGALAFTLKTGGKIPREVQALQHQFDVVTMLSTHPPAYHIEILFNFFRKNEGVGIFINEENTFIKE